MLIDEEQREILIKATKMVELFLLLGEVKRRKDPALTSKVDLILNKMVNKE